MKKALLSLLLFIMSQSAHSELLSEVTIILLLNAVVAADALEPLRDLFGNAIGVRIDSGDIIPNRFLEEPVVENIYFPGLGTITGSPTPSEPSGTVIPGASFSTSSISMTNDATTPSGMFIGDVLSIAFNGGSHSAGGLRFDSIAFNFLSPGGTALDGLDYRDLDGLTVADFDSASFTVFARDTSFNSIIGTGAITSLSATVVPVPAAIWFLLSAVGALGFTTKRKAT